MNGTGKSLLTQYHTPEEALRWALVRMAEASGLNKYLLAPQVDLSPSHFSKALNPNKSDDDSERRHHFPADRIARYIQVCGDASYLYTLLDFLGFNPDELHKIRRPVKSSTQLLEEQNAMLAEATKMIGDVLKLRVQDGGGRTKGRK